MKQRDGFRGASALMFLLMGSFFATSQLLVNHVRLAYSATEGQMGMMVGALFVGSMTMVLLFGEFAERVGKRIACAVAALFVCTGAAVVAFSGSVGMAIAGFAIYGAGTGGFESTLTSLVADKNGEKANRSVNLLQALFSIGAVAAPLILSAILGADQFRAVYVIVAAVYACISIYFLLCKPIDNFAVRSGHKEGGMAVFRLLKNPLLLAYMAAMILYIGTETTVTYWISSYFSSKGFPALGAVALSAFWLSGIAGRLVGSRFQSAEKLVTPCFLVAAVAAVLLVVLPGGTTKLLAVVLFGLAYGPLYGGITVMGGSLFPEHTAASYSLMVFAGGLGGTIFQPLISALVRSGDAGRVYLMVSGVCVVIAALLFWTGRRAAKVRQAAGH